MAEADLGNKTTIFNDDFLQDLLRPSMIPCLISHRKYSKPAEVSLDKDRIAQKTPNQERILTDENQSLKRLVKSVNEIKLKQVH